MNMAKKRKTKSNEKKDVVGVATVTATLVCSAKRMKELLHTRVGFTARALGREEKKAIAEELKGVYKERIEKHYIPNSPEVYDKVTYGCSFKIMECDLIISGKDENERG